MAVLTRSTIPAVIHVSIGATVDILLEAQTGGGYAWEVGADLGGHIEVSSSYRPGA